MNDDYLDEDLHQQLSSFYSIGDFINQTQNIIDKYYDWNNESLDQIYLDDNPPISNYIFYPNWEDVEMGKHFDRKTESEYYELTQDHPLGPFQIEDPDQPQQKEQQIKKIRQMKQYKVLYNIWTRGIGWLGGISLDKWTISFNYDFSIRGSIQMKARYNRSPQKILPGDILLLFISIPCYNPQDDQQLVSNQEISAECEQKQDQKQHGIPLYMLIYALQVAIPVCLRYLGGALPIFVGFTLLGISLFGERQVKFSTIGEAMMALFALMNGDELLDMFDWMYSSTETSSFSQDSSEYQEISPSNFSRTISSIAATLYLFTFLLFFITVIFNIFISIIEEAYHLARKKIAPREDDLDYEIEDDDEEEEDIVEDESDQNEEAEQINADDADDEEEDNDDEEQEQASIKALEDIMEDITSKLGMEQNKSTPHSHNE
ncbi:MAG: hypothetical protein EZS28_022626 [Streblomastix strix]|uniref:Ion transport domain-containing protein n=1 Tax=Streblomastix strix TaxID=222440 RepID=A0A5J4VGV4_9EUKA|nr:MAG: hypothetical protein EZS28_022626 [Streblomastix strix]